MKLDNQRLAHRQICSSSVIDFTQKMFLYMNKCNYIIGEHHMRICDALDSVVAGKTKKLIINIAPRYGKTLLVARMFIAYGLAINPSSKFLHLSYSGSLAQDNSMAIKDIVENEYYKSIFDTRLRMGNNTKSYWSTEQNGGVYATTTLGQVTGFGAGQVELEDDEQNIDEYTAKGNGSKFAGAIVIDDPIKPEDALSDNMREAVNRRFETTIRNRVNSRNTPIIIIMQRLHEHDLCGYLQEIEPGEWKVLSLPCIYQDEETGEEKALWEFKHTLDELHKLRGINPFVFETQYMQNPKPMEGLLYTQFRTYETLPIEPRRKMKYKNYTDTADTGSDYLCSVCYIEYEYGMYITDVLYTKKPMEYTETETARMLNANGTDYAIIESNNGGRGFARNVEKNLRSIGNTKTFIKTFQQTNNKKSRIFTHSADVQNMVFYPAEWEKQWPDFARAIKGYRKEGSNANDDAPDVLTGMVENFGKIHNAVSDKTLKGMML